MTGALLEGIVTQAMGNRFAVFSQGVYYGCQLRGRVRYHTHQTSPVAVGDDVVISLIGDMEGVIERVRERRTVLSRPGVHRQDTEDVLAANVDVLMIVVSTASPPLRAGLIDRFIIAARIGRLTPAIVINKIDLRFDSEIEEIAAIYCRLGFDLFLTSAADGRGGDELGRFLGEHHSLLAGHSGVGKSSLLNRLLPDVKLRTAEISSTSGKGRHTTSRVEMFPLPQGGWVIDSPGIRVLGLWQLEREELDRYYPEMADCRAACRFAGCSHISEPDCAVKRAVEEGSIARLRYDNYCRIYESL